MYLLVIFTPYVINLRIKSLDLIRFLISVRNKLLSYVIYLVLILLDLVKFYTKFLR